MPATSTKVFSNEGICGDFGTLTARAGPPASDEPAEDVKFSRVADLSQDFSERVRALGLNSDVYPLAEDVRMGHIRRARGWIGCCARRATRGGSGRRLRRTRRPAVPRAFVRGPRRWDRPAGTFPERRRRWNELGGSFDYRTWTVKTARLTRRGGFEPPRARSVLAPSGPVGSWGSRRPRRTGSSFETCERSRTSIRTSWRTRCTAEAAGTCGRRRGSTRSTPAAKMQRDDAAAAAAGGGGAVKRRRR